MSIAEQLVTQSRSTMKREPKRKLRRAVSTPKPRQVSSDNVSPKPPPKHLTTATRAWWKAIVAAYELEEHQYKILLVAAESLDRREQARAALKKHGLTFTDDRGMIRSRPENAIERECSVAFLRALRALRLEGEAT